MKRLLISSILVAISLLAVGRFNPRENATSASEFDIVRGSSSWTMESDGLDREFRMYVPDNLSLDKEVPLVVMIHGRFESAKHAEGYYRWNDVADIGGFVVAYPNGTDRAWNAGGGCCRAPGRTGQNDVRFILDMIDQISSRMPVDPDRVFAAGMSNGAKMTYRLACETDRFAAIAPVAGLQLVPCDSPSPTSVLAIHGMDDTFAPFNDVNGTDPSQFGTSSVPEISAFWRTVNACRDPITVTIGDVADTYSVCADGRAVELIAIANMTHIWPGGGGRPIDQMFSALRGGDDFIATVLIWEFFTSHPRIAG